MTKKHSYLLLILFLFSACQQVIEKTAENLVAEKKELIGKYHTLKSEKIKVFLPEEFNYISTKNYLEYIEKLKDTFLINTEKQRVDFIKNTGRKIYFFEHFESGSIANIMPEKYIKFSNTDAKYLLAIIDKTIKSNSRPYIQYELLESQFKGNKNLKIFKAIYEVKSPKIEMKIYKHVYFISYNKKSVLFNLETPVQIDCDPYIEKIRI